MTKIQKYNFNKIKALYEALIEEELAKAPDNQDLDYIMCLMALYKDLPKNKSDLYFINDMNKTDFDLFLTNSKDLKEYWIKSLKRA